MRNHLLFVFVLMSIFVLMFSLSSTALSWSTSSATFGSGTFYQLPGGVVDKSSPTLADLTGDGVPEILVGTTNESYANTPATYDQPTVLVVLSGNGSILWSRDVGAPINSSPAVADINNDGEPEIVVSFGGSVLSPAQPGGVIAYDSSGNSLWRFTTLDHFPVDGVPDGIFGSPTLCDVENDGDMEIAIGSWDQRIYLLDHQGNSLWNDAPYSTRGQGYLNADSIWSSAACADLNQDGYQEIIIGADITGGGTLPDGTITEDGGYLYIFDKDGNVLVRYYLEETIYSSPAVGDLDGNGTLEIVVGTGYFYWNAHGRTETSFVHVFDTSNVFKTYHYADPNKLPSAEGWPQITEYPGFSSPALADLDSNGDLEIIIGTGHPDLANDAIPGAGQVYAWHHTGQLVNGWPISPKNANGDDTAVFSSPTVADVDADGELEILFSMIWDIHVYNANGSFQERLPTTWTIWGSPAIGDADDNGKVDVWIGASRNGNDGGDQSKGYIWKFEQTATGIGAQPWPQFHADATNSGYYPLASELIAPASLTIFHQPDTGNQAQGTLMLENSGDLPLNFRIDADSNRIKLLPTSGQIQGGDNQSLLVTVNTQALDDGTYELDSLNIYDSDTNEQITQVDVRLYIGENVTHIYLPLTTRQGQNTSLAEQADIVYWTVDKFALPSGQIIDSSPIAADLDGDGMDEIIAASSNQQCGSGICTQDAPTLLTVTRSNGTLLWSQNTGGPVASTPAVADINQDGSLEIVVTVGADPYQAGTSGHVMVFNAQGTLLWEFYTKDQSGNGFADGIFGSPTLCDLNGNGNLEIIFGALDGYIYALQSNGTLLWEYHNDWEIRSTAACADLNSDGLKEVVIGAGSNLNGPSQTGGFVYVFSSNGGVLARRAMQEAITSSPAIGDIDGDGDKEIAVGTGLAWWQQNGGSPAPQVNVFDTSLVFSALAFNDPAKLPFVPGWPQLTNYPTVSSPALADLDQDGDMEIVIGTAHPTLADDGVLGAGSVYAWHHNGQVVNGWPVDPSNLEGNNGVITSSPVIADIDLDGQPEVLVTMVWRIFIYNVDGSEQLYLPRTEYTLSSSPVVVDSDQDGKIELWVAASDQSNEANGYLWLFESKMEGFGELIWPMFRQNASHTGTQ